MEERLMPRWLLWLCLALCCVNTALILCRDGIARLWVNAEAGCWPWSPAEVEYRDGMTICPGQSVHATIVIIVPQERRDGGI